MNQSNSSTIPRQKTRFVVNNGNVSIIYVIPKSWEWGFPYFNAFTVMKIEMNSLFQIPDHVEFFSDNY